MAADPSIAQAAVTVLIVPATGSPQIGFAGDLHRNDQDFSQPWFGPILAPR